MIDRIVVKNFKSIRGVDLTLSRMNLFIGDNASGKSNFLEVPRVLQGIGKGLTIPEVLDGDLDDAQPTGWQGIRGGSAMAHSLGNLDPDQGITIEAHGRLRENVSHGWEFKITFTPADGRVVRESLTLDSAVVYSVEDSAVPYMAQMADKYRHIDPIHPCADIQHESGDLSESIPELNPVQTPTRPSSQKPVFDQPTFHTLANSHPAISVARSLENVQRLDLFPSFIRDDCASHQTGRMGDQGKGFTALIRAICEDERTSDQYFSWIREFSSPDENDVIDALSSLKGSPSGSSRVDSSIKLSALSDGTLRFATLVAAFFQADMPEIMLIDEIETSIHASRIRLLVELLTTQVECTPTQVIATSHSPVVLEWLTDEGLADVFFCNRDEITGETMIRPLLQVPHLERSIKEKPFFDMLTERWLELISCVIDVNHASKLDSL